MENTESLKPGAIPSAAPATAGALPPYKRKLADVPGPKGSFLFGNLKQINPNKFHLAFEQWAAEYGSFFKVHLGRQPVLVVSNPVITRKILRERPDALRRGSRLARAFSDLGSNGQLTTSSAFTAEGDEWRKHRKLIMRALTPQVIQNFFPTLSGMTDRLRRRWTLALQEGRKVDVLRDLKAYTLDVTLGLTMGQDINTLERVDDPLHHDIAQIFDRAARRLAAIFPYWRYFKLPIDRSDDACAMRLEEAIKGFIATARKSLDENPQRREKPGNLLEALVVARDEPGSGFTDFNVIGNVLLMVFAGEDTTAHTTAWLLSFIARHPDVARHLTAETDAALGASPVAERFESLGQFPYTVAAATEALRIKPAAPLLNLETNHDQVIADILVPKGTPIISVVRPTGMNEADFAQAHLFQPERWLNDTAGDMYDDPERKLFPFGGGPRFCPGRYLAMVEFKMIISMMMRNFTFELDPAAPPIEELFTFTLTPSALPLRLALR